MLRWCFVFLLIAIGTRGQAQSVVPPNIRAGNTIDKLTDMRGLETGEMLFGIPLAPGKIIGDTYLDTRWKIGSIMLYEKDKVVERYPIRYDIHANELDIQVGQNIKVLSGNKIRSFSWIDSAATEPVYFINARDFVNEEGVKFTGFFCVLVDGPLPLLCKTELVVRKADYNEQLNVGRKDDTILKKEHYYYLQAGKAIEMPSRKKLPAIFTSHASEVEKYIKDNHIGASREHDLVLVFNYYKTLVKY